MKIRERDSIVEKLLQKHGGDNSEFWQAYYEIYEKDENFRDATLQKFGLPPEIKSEHTHGQK